MRTLMMLSLIALAACATTETKKEDAPVAAPAEQPAATDAPGTEAPATEAPATP